MIPRCHIPPQAEPARSAAAGRRPDRLSRDPARLVQALRARLKGDEEEKMREKKRRLEAGGVRQREGQGCCWRSQCKAESLGQRRAARREPCWKNQLISGKRNKKVQQHYTMRCNKMLTRWF